MQLKLAQLVATELSVCLLNAQFMQPHQNFTFHSLPIRVLRSYVGMQVLKQKHKCQARSTTLRDLLGTMKSLLVSLLVLVLLVYNTSTSNSNNTSTSSLLVSLLYHEDSV